MNSQREHAHHGEGGPRERIPTVWGRVPPRSMNFIGREGPLAGLRRELRSGAATVVLHGHYGVGKSLTAVEHVHRSKAEYDLVWWIPAGQPGLVRSNMAQLAQHLGLPGPGVTGIEDAASGVLDALRRGEPYRRWLLVFDSADEPEDLYELIPEGTGHVLITSRNHRWTGRATTVPIEVFPPRESAEFLRRRVPQGLDEASAADLAQALGHLPLALEQAGALLTETGMSSREYLRLLERRPEDLLSQGHPPDYHASLSASLQISLKELAAGTPEAVELLETCSVFGPEPIPRDVFFATDSPHVRPGTAALLNDPIRLSRAFGQLGRYALVKIDNANRTIQVHSLVQKLIRWRLDAERLRAVRTEVCALLAAAEPVGLLGRQAQDRYLDLLPHLEPAGVPLSELPEARRLSLSVLSFLYFSGNYATAENHARNLIARWAAAFGEDDPDLLKAKRSYANRLRDLGRYEEAYRLNVAMLPRIKEVLGPDHPETLTLLSGIGADLRAQGRFREAFEHDTETYRLHVRALGPDHNVTLRALHNLAIDHTLLSDFAGARLRHEQAYMLYKRQASADGSPNLAAFWNSLAQAVRLSGKYAEACDLGEEALAYGREQLGREHPRTLRVQLDLSIAHRLSGNLERARTLARDAHDRYLRLYDADHPETLAAAMCLVNLMRVEGDLDGALSTALDALERYARVYGPDHPYHQACAANTALVHRLRGDAGQARRMNEATLRSLDVLLGRDHHYSLAVANNLAGDLAALGETAAAVRSGRDTVRRLRALIGDEHPMTLAGTANLALDLAALGEEGEARSLAEAARASYTRVLGAGHILTRTMAAGGRMTSDLDPPLL
nr:FxSxx-COOH system tetratricopeptide repeat protein [Nocardiopsis changdeensis]